MIENEKRRFPRIKSDIVASVQATSSDDDVLADQGSLIAEMSLTGLFVATQQKFSLGDLIQVIFRLPPDNHQVQTHGTVMYCGERDGKAGVGVEFENLSGKNRLELYQHVMGRLIGDLDEKTS